MRETVDRHTTNEPPQEGLRSNRPTGGLGLWGAVGVHHEYMEALFVTQRTAKPEQILARQGRTSLSVLWVRQRWTIHAA